MGRDDKDVTMVNQPRAPHATNPTVLLVDDEDTVRLSLARALRRGGYEVLTAADGAEALEILRTARISVLLTDYHMMSMNGMELMSAVQVAAPSTVRILMTARIEAEDAIHAVWSGLASRSLTKPFEPQELFDAITQAISERETHGTTRSAA